MKNLEIKNEPFTNSRYRKLYGIKEDLNKWRDLPCYQKKTFSMVKMSLPK